MVYRPLLLGVVALLSQQSLAATVQFRVIAPGATEVQVSVNGQNTPLTAQDPNVPYFVGQAEAGDQAKYKYIVGGTAEGFDRTLDAGRTETRNDFFDRPITYANIPKLPWPIKENPQWTRGGPESPMYDSNYIPSIFMTMDPAERDTLVTTVPSTMYSAKFTFIGPDEVLTFENCSFGVHGAGKKHNNDKQSWKWTLPEGKNIYNRNYFKLRHQEEDPTQMREKAYSDILQAMGVYANDANLVRFFINGLGFGTFNMLDDVKEYSFINAVFYNGKPPQQMGPLYDGASGADFQYYPDGEGYNSFIPNAKSPETQEAINQVAEAFNKTDVSNDQSVAEFAKIFDIDSFLRFMVMEYLAGHWDGYWFEQTNDGAYRDPTDNKWYYLGQDYDGTFGVNLAEPEGEAFVGISYTQYPQRYPAAVLINRLLENANQRNKFETYLKDTVAVLFNNVTLTNRLLKYHEFILPDLQWDRSIKQLSPGIPIGWSFEQTTQNLWEAVSPPSNATGGAGWGLIQWVIAKSEAVAKEFNIQITKEPVGPPNDSSVSASEVAATASATGGVSAAGTSSAAHVLPTVSLALLAVALHLFLIH